MFDFNFPLSVVLYSSVLLLLPSETHLHFLCSSAFSNQASIFFWTDSLFPFECFLMSDLLLPQTCPPHGPLFFAQLALSPRSLPLSLLLFGFSLCKAFVCPFFFQYAKQLRVLLFLLRVTQVPTFHHRPLVKFPCRDLFFLPKTLPFEGLFPDFWFLDVFPIGPSWFPLFPHTFTAIYAFPSGPC